MCNVFLDAEMLIGRAQVHDGTTKDYGGGAKGTGERALR